MTLLALTKSQEAGGQIALAVALAVAGVFLLLPRPKGRFVAGGIAALVAAAAVFGAWVYQTFGHPVSDIVGTALFWLFSAGALIFGTILVAQKNPGRGAIAFAFVILSTCGLFLLLAAPFLMAATIIIYAGAIIVTFLFVLMLSHAEGPSDENDRSREPLYGSFAGFAFVGLVLFTLYQTSQAGAPTDSNATKLASRHTLPARVITPEERQILADAIAKLGEAEKHLDGDVSSGAARDERDRVLTQARELLVPVVGHSSGKDPRVVHPGSLHSRLEGAVRPNEPGAQHRDPQAFAALKQASAVRDASQDVGARVEGIFQGEKPDVEEAKAEVRRLRGEVLLLSGVGQLPARNVANLGFLLYSEHLLAIELAGTLLLVATIGAVAISHRKGVAK